MDALRRLRQAVLRRPGKLAFLLFSLGLSFGFAATVVAITHASWFRLPAAVAAGEYVTLGRRTASDVARLTLADYDNVKALAPEVSWFYRRAGQLAIRDPGGTVRRIPAPRVSGRFFERLGIAAAAGRLVASGEGPAAVLGYDLWRSLFDARASVTEEFLQIDGGLSVPIVGVAAQPFTGLLGEEAEAWILDAPFDLTGPPNRDEATARDIYRKFPSMHIFGVAKSPSGTVPIRKLRALFADYTFDASGVAQRSQSDDETTTVSFLSWGVLATDRLVVTPGIEANPDRQRDVQQKLVWLIGVVLLLLAMALVSLVDFLMAENLARAEEQTVRIAVGAGPADVFRQTLAENTVWIAIVAAIGWFASAYISDLLLGVEPFSSYIGELPEQARFAGTLGGALLLGLAFACGAGYASWFVSKASRSMAATHRRPDQLARALRATLLFVGVTSLLLVFSLVGRYAGDARFTLNFENVDVLIVQAHTAETPSLQTTFLDAIDAIPGTASSATASLLPLAEPRMVAFARGTLRNEPGLAETPFYHNSVSHGFFQTLGVPLLAGRLLDSEPTNEVVLSRAAALALAGDVDAALGRPVVFWKDIMQNMDLPDDLAMNVPAKTVVGVVEDVRYGDYAAAAVRAVYDRRHDMRSTFHRFLIDHGGEADDIVRMMGESPAFEGWTIQAIGTPHSWFQDQFMARRSVEMILSGAGAFALVLALAGVANSFARALAAERSAISIRFALGAMTSDVSRAYAASVLRDLLLIAALVGALALAAKFASPEAAAVVDLWLLIPATLCLAAVCAAVAHLLVRQFARLDSLTPLIQGGAYEATQ